MRRSLGIALATVVALAAVTARADEPPRSERPIDRGRALTWGFAVIVPVWLGDLREPGGRGLEYVNPGGGVEGRIGFELPGGLALGVAGGISAHASDNSRAINAYRGGAEARWTIDVGEIVAPSFGIAVGFMLVELDATGIRPTAYARVLAGAQILFAPWLAMELGVSLEGALGIDAFRDPVVWVSPQIGLSFYE